MNKSKFIAAAACLVLVVPIFALSCGHPSRNTSILGSMLSAVPSQLASDSILWFSNLEKMKELTGVNPDAEAIEFFRAPTEAEYQRRQDILAGYTLSDFSGGSHLERWQDSFGFDGFETSQEIWAESLVQPNSTRSLFSVMEGNFDKNNVIEKLNGLGYQLKSHASIGYYSVNADNQVGDLKSSQAARMAMANLNRMMVEEQEIIAAPADDIFFSVLDVRSGRQGSLEDSLAYTRVAGSLGDVLGAVLIPQSILRSRNVSAEWANLHPYDLAGIGYRVEGQHRKVAIALHYPDRSAADDVDELARRLAEYVVTTGDLETPLLPDLFDIGEPEVTVYGPDSILKVELVYRPGTPGTLWSDMVPTQDLGFLVSNPSQP
jgi:hypothetical protein